MVNGKVKRFIRTLLNAWAYPSSETWDAYLLQWRHDYNGHRPHTSLGNQALALRSGTGVNNVVKPHS